VLSGLRSRSWRSGTLPLSRPISSARSPRSTRRGRTNTKGGDCRSINFLAGTIKRARPATR